MPFHLVVDEESLGSSRANKSAVRNAQPWCPSQTLGKKGRSGQMCTGLPETVPQALSSMLRVLVIVSLGSEAGRR